MKKDLIFPGSTEHELILQGLDGDLSPQFRELFPSGNQGILFADPMTGRFIVGDERLLREYNNEEVGCPDEGINPNYQEWMYYQTDGQPLGFETSEPLTFEETQIVNQIMSS